jgi:hypothetical protein
MRDGRNPITLEEEWALEERFQATVRGMRLSVGAKRKILSAFQSYLSERQGELFPLPGAFPESADDPVFEFVNNGDGALRLVRDTE